MRNNDFYQKNDWEKWKNLSTLVVSIKPDKLVKILNKEATLLIKKKTPKHNLPCMVYLYCNKGSKLKYNEKTEKYYLFDSYHPPLNTPIRGDLNGKVVGVFLLEEAHDTFYEELQMKNRLDEVCQKACVSKEELWVENANNNISIWKITDLKGWFLGENLEEFGLTKAPQSWAYIK